MIDVIVHAAMAVAIGTAIVTFALDEPLGAATLALTLVLVCRWAWRSA